MGVDLVEVPRMERVLASRYASRFLERVFSPAEREACELSPVRGQCYAARFAAKEAVAKALGTGFGQGVSPIQITVVGGERNQPRIALHGAALAHARFLGVSAIHVSLTHTRQYACAFAVLDGNSEEAVIHS
ncbi:MAG: holo-ACP synthase [Thermodesulfobacteriota bacterium]